MKGLVEGLILLAQLLQHLPEHYLLQLKRFKDWQEKEIFGPGDEIFVSYSVFCSKAILRKCVNFTFLYYLSNVICVSSKVSDFLVFLQYDLVLSLVYEHLGQQYILLYPYLLLSQFYTEKTFKKKASK